MVFDEATSSVDSQSEQAIYEAIMRLFGEKTLIIIAHRLSTAQRADRIVVIVDGEKKEEGVHDSLMKSDTTYRRLYSSQFK